MTRVELQQAILGLPAGERVDLAEALLGSLSEADRAALRTRHLERAHDRFQAEIAKGFASGEGRIWADKDWQRLMRGEYQHSPEADSWAVPPGWRSPRLEEP